MLKNDPREITLFFDLEWVPDAQAAIKLYDLPPDTPEPEAIEHLWKNTSGYSDACPRPFVKYLFSRVVSIAFLSRKVVWVDGVKTVDFGLHSLPKLPVDHGERPDEGELIDRFLYIIGEREPTLVGYNSAESDLQVLIQRGLIHEVSAPRFCERPAKPWEGRDYFYKYSEEHLDLLTRFSNGKMTPRLNELAKLCGFPGKLDTDGAAVVDLWLAGEIEKIVEYNQIDALNTYLVWLRTVRFCGRISDEDYAAEQLQLQEYLETEAERSGRDHLRQFLAKWDL
jgi:predicted PolB exonuclease-like 3'-5' exonuclease